MCIIIDASCIYYSFRCTFECSSDATSGGDPTGFYRSGFRCSPSCLIEPKLINCGDIQDSRYNDYNETHK